MAASKEVSPSQGIETDSFIPAKPEEIRRAVFETTDVRRLKKFTLGRFNLDLRKAVGEIARLHRIDFESIPPTSQTPLMLQFMAEVFNSANGEHGLPQAVFFESVEEPVLPAGRPEQFDEDQIPRFLHEREILHAGERQREIVVNPDLVEVEVSREGQKPEVIRFGKTRKQMLAYLVALTQAKLDRFQVPYVSADELLQYSPFSEEQYRNNLFKPLLSLGMVSSSMARGYLLNVTTDSFRNIIEGKATRYSLSTKDFRQWYQQQFPGRPLFGEHHTKTLMALYELWPQSPTGTFLVQQVEAMVFPGNWAVEKHLRDFVEMGVIRKKKRYGSYKYRWEEVNTNIISEFATKQGQEIEIHVFDSGRRGKAAGERKSRSLRISDEERILTPQGLWRDAGLKAADIDFSDETAYGRMYTVLSARMTARVLYDKVGKPIYLGGLPQVEGVSASEICAYLNLMGVTPQLMQEIDTVTSRNLAAGIRELTQGYGTAALAQERALGAKQRILELVQSRSEVSKDEIKRIPMQEIMKQLYQRAEAAFKLQQERIIFQQQQASKAGNGSNGEYDQEEIFEAIDPQILLVVSSVFEKELQSAIAQPSLPTSELMPTQSFSFHSSLSRRANKNNIPWTELFGMGLAHRARGSGKDNHPTITAAGALISAVYLNKAVQDRLGANGKSKTLETVIQYCAHLYREKLAEASGGEDSKKADYATHCLEELESARHSCRCRDCLSLSSQ